MKINFDKNGLPLTERSNATHAAILNMAVAVAASEGLEALTIGRLANCLNMSRSGIFSHFKSKEDLQLETLDWAYQLFDAEVISPAANRPAGMLQVKGFIEGLFRYHSENCFLTHVSAEFDSRDGDVKDKIVEIHKRLAEHLELFLKAAIKNEHIDSISDQRVKQLTFSILSIFMGSQILYQLRIVPNVVSMRQEYLANLFANLITTKAPEEIHSWLLLSAQHR